MPFMAVTLPAKLRRLAQHAGRRRVCQVAAPLFGGEFIDPKDYSKQPCSR